MKDFEGVFCVFLGVTRLSLKPLDVDTKNLFGDAKSYIGFRLKMIACPPTFAPCEKQGNGGFSVQIDPVSQSIQCGCLELCNTIRQTGLDTSTQQHNGARFEIQSVVDIGHGIDG